MFVPTSLEDFEIWCKKQNVKPYNVGKEYIKHLSPQKFKEYFLGCFKLLVDVIEDNLYNIGYVIYELTIQNNFAILNWGLYLDDTMEQLSDDESFFWASLYSSCKLAFIGERQEGSKDTYDFLGIFVKIDDLTQYIFKADEITKFGFTNKMFNRLVIGGLIGTASSSTSYPAFSTYDKNPFNLANNLIN